MDFKTHKLRMQLNGLVAELRKIRTDNSTRQAELQRLENHQAKSRAEETALQAEADELMATEYKPLSTDCKRLMENLDERQEQLRRALARFNGAKAARKEALNSICKVAGGRKRLALLLEPRSKASNTSS